MTGSLSTAETEIRPQMAARLSVRHVSMRYRSVLAVDDVSLSVEAGEFVCLVGPSGCGKSSLLRVIAGLQRQAGGQIFIDGAEVAGPGVFVPPERRGVGLMFQDYALFPHLDVLQNVSFGLSGLPAGARRAKAMAALEAVGMTRYVSAYPHMLSGGEQQRVALARALAPRPKIMLMDEPFSGLDRQLREEVRAETLEILAQSGTAGVMVTHDPEEAMLLADRIALMRKGRLVQTGAPDEIYFHPVDAEAAEFFSSYNRLHGQVSGGRVMTALGEVAAHGLADGTGVEVLIRPDQINVSVGAPHTGEISATILRSAPQGQRRLLDLSLEDGTRLQARILKQDCPPSGAAAGVRTDLGQALVFPCRCGREVVSGPRNQPPSLRCAQDSDTVA